eukprot:GFUD01032894.1.p1 GENE.GFUD01032894.1~~GFUD01032894.1.p1  ORF type:complete len:508 (+),score=108.55 GFUD01032894.1:113-1636(+)
MWIECLLLFLSLFLGFYVYITKHFGYFKANGVPEAKGTFPFGSEPMWKMMLGKLNVLNLLDDIVKEFPNDRFFGMFFFRQRVIIVKDQELAKIILIKDADHFADRPSVVVDSKIESEEIVNMFLTSLKGEQWKKMRSIVSPVFTSGKLKLMVPHIDKCAKNLEEVLAAAASSGEVLEAKDVYGKFNLDAIATSGFGIESNSFKEPNSVFRTTALKMVRAEGYASKWDILKFFVFAVSPKFAQLLGLTMMPPGTIEFFAGIIRQTVEKRREMGTRRNDIIDLLMDELNKDNNKSEQENEDDFDMEIALISNAIIFFFAGFDTSSMSMAVAVFSFITNPSIQEKARQEIQGVVGDSDNITFEHLQDLKYTENCINEALRFYGLVTSLQRICTKDYKIPDSNFTIPKDMSVTIHDKLYQNECFFNAEQFDPDNFAAENNPNKFGFSSFGQGPRNCIGMRYAYIAIKLALVHTLSNFKLVKCAQTPEKLEFELTKNYFKDGVKFKVEPLIQ